MLTRAQTNSLERIESPSWLERGCLLEGKRPPTRSCLQCPLLGTGCSVLVQLTLGAT